MMRNVWFKKQIIVMMHKVWFKKQIIVSVSKVPILYLTWNEKHMQAQHRNLLLFNYQSFSCKNKKNLCCESGDIDKLCRCAFSGSGMACSCC